MNTRCDPSLSVSFTSRSQQVRVVTEAWFASHGYCLACQSDKVVAAKPNSAAKDFYCPLCSRSYELKSGERLSKKRVADGAYATMIERIRSNDPPTLMLLTYHRYVDSELPWHVEHLYAIHPMFLTDAVVEARKPLSPQAKRAGWQGCNLRIDRIPPEGYISLIHDGQPVSPTRIRELYQSSNRLSLIDSDERGWTTQVLRIIRRIGKQKFTLDEVYEFRKVFKRLSQKTSTSMRRYGSSFKY